MSTTTFEQAKAINGTYRTAAMNRKYYACRLHQIHGWNRAFEITIAVASSATIAAWRTWETGSLAVAWKTFAAAAAVLAVIKPFIGLTKEIERFSELVGGYTTLYYDMKQIVEDIKAAGAITPEIWERFCNVRQRTKDLGMKDDLVARKKLHRRCYDEILKEIPTHDLWWPKEDAA